MRGWLVVAAAVLSLTACGKKKPKLAPLPPAPAASASVPRPTSRPAPPPAIPPAAPPPTAVPTVVIERGNASWYGHPYHGRRAADGEVYDMETLVAAHRTLPFQTWVRVRNVANNKTVDVRIIDRGPFVGNRIIDLSHAAARQIELIGPGVGPVELTLLSEPPDAAAGLFGVQVGAFRERANADRLQASLAQLYGAAKIVERPGEPTMWRVLAGSEKSSEAAEALAKRVRAEQHVSQAFVVRLD